MMTTGSLLDDGIELSFTDGNRRFIHYREFPEVRSREGIAGLELPNPNEMVLQTAGSEDVEIPWAFARHYCDATYRPTVESIAAPGRLTVGERVRRYRETAGMTQVALSRAADIGRATLVRLDRGGSPPVSRH